MCFVFVVRASSLVSQYCCFVFATSKRKIIEWFSRYCMNWEYRLTTYLVYYRTTKYPSLWIYYCRSSETNCSNSAVSCLNGFKRLKDILNKTQFVCVKFLAITNTLTFVTMNSSKRSIGYWSMFRMESLSYYPIVHTNHMSIILLERKSYE